MRILIVGSGSLARSLIAYGVEMNHDVLALRWRDFQGEGRGGLLLADVVINAHGANPKRTKWARDQLTRSVSQAHRLAAIATESAVPSLHVSTDCVLGHQAIRGRKAAEGVVLQARPDDTYGYAMALREQLVIEEKGWVARTSFITPREGIWADVASKDIFRGWAHAVWSGSLVSKVALQFLHIALQNVSSGRTPESWGRSRIINVCSPVLRTKLEVARHLIRTLDYPCDLKSDLYNRDDRGMMPSEGGEVPDVLECDRADLEECIEQQMSPTAGLSAEDWEQVWRYGAPPPEVYYA